MGHPIPGFTITTPFGSRGDHWSCDKDSAGRGIHTGDDYSTSGKIGFPVLATAKGRVVIVNSAAADGGWGGAYGNHVVIESGDVRHGYCHLSKILVAVGTEIEEGQRIGLSGNTGNVAGSIGPHFGAHLHYEERTGNFLFCDRSRKPGLTRGPGPGFTIDVGDVFVSKLRKGSEDSDSVRRLQDVLNGIHLTGRKIEVTGDYTDPTHDEVRAWQMKVVGMAADSPFATGDIPGIHQAMRLFARTGNRVIDDVGQDTPG
jgi:murein DD-endopeptidase MepM/ murein hydrolase activator NlpD